MTTLDDAPATTEAAGAAAPDAAPATGGHEPAGTSSPAAEAGSPPQGQPKADEPKKEGRPQTALEKVLADERERRDAAERAAAPAAPAAVADQRPEAPARPAGDDGGEARIPDEMYKALPPVVKHRIASITKQRNEIRQRLTEAEPRLVRDGQLQQFLTTNGIGSDEFAWLMEAARLTKRDPARAYEHLTPLIDQLRQHAGEVLPDDLRRDVEAGTLSSERARELARARNTLQVRETVGAQDAERQAAERAQADFAAKVNAVASSLSSWEAQWKGSDPDFAHLLPLVRDKIMFAVSEKQRRKGGAPLSTEEALEIANAARKAVKEQLAGMNAPPRSKSTVTGGVAVRAAAEPKNAMEAARLGLARAHGQ